MKISLELSHLFCNFAIDCSILSYLKRQIQAVPFIRDIF